MISCLTQLRTFLVLIAALLIAHCNIAQTVQSMRPSLIAIQVDDLDKSLRWYKEYLEFRVLDRKDFKDHGLSIAILELADFKLELVDNDKALNKGVLLKQHGIDEITGFAKVTFTIDDVRSLYDKLLNKGAAFAITLRESNVNPKEQFFIALDCDNNWLQFIGPK